MKKITNLEGVQVLNRNNQKEIIGGHPPPNEGIRTILETGDCIAVAHAVTGSTSSCDFLAHYTQCMNDFEERRDD